MTKHITWKMGQARLKDLIDYEHNPVQIKDRAAKELARNLREKGQDLPYVIASPLVKDKPMPLLDGHQRKACDLEINKADPNKLVPVLYPDKKLSEREKKEWIITHRKNTGEWNFDVLANQFDVPDLLDWGFSEKELQIGGFEFEDEGEGSEQETKPTLSDRFGVPPFSVLNARGGVWQDRKRAWLALGIESELGRGGGGGTPPHPPTVTQNEDGTLNYGGTTGQDARFDRQRQANATPSGSLRPAMTLVNGKTVRGDGKGRRLTWVEGDRPQEQLDDTSRKNLAAGRKATAKVFGSGGAGELSASFKDKKANAITGHSREQVARGYENGRYIGTTDKNKNGLLGFSEQARNHYKDGEREDTPQTGTSIFDPVLCELAYRWFMPQDGGKVLDPFAGGSVRGIVASILGKQYTGIDLSKRQIKANVIQGKALCKKNMPKWINGNSLNVKKLAKGEYDFVFSCPPYADLEIYSDDPEDLSRMEYKEFIKAYREIIAQSVSMLKDNRFACFVVGDVRDKKGFYRNFPAHTIDAFQDAGMILYNEAILVTAVGSLPIRVGRQFDGGRKLGKTHQNVLVFYKGNPKAIKDFGVVEFGEVSELEGADEIAE